MRSPEGERGSVTAEFAVALPAVVVCLALCLGAVFGAARYVGLAGSASAAARLAGRGDDPGSIGAGGAVRSIDHEGEMVCVTLTDTAGTVLARLGIRLEAHACALDESVGSADPSAARSTDPSTAPSADPSAVPAASSRSGWSPRC
ncbi:hypothetical protein [Leifsonia shinshuensis]|uniref:hypothetical protein n=1 Tax=Leifsonia shinshuensis TaxID=150026 RepID=UPI002860C8DC|nr:hypothetical protein [Leifsonia shinshuensis]MDR6973150.1 hypothetical protein [Leifsonia shinshuensis]